MKYGSLTLVAGPMFAGKTNDLIKEILFRSYFSETERRSIRVFKLALDNRYDRDCIVSHDRAGVEAVCVSGADDIDSNGADFVFIDEIQFFMKPYFSGDMLDVVRTMRAEGADVFCSGLDVDYLGRAFEITASLMAEASEVRRLHASCDICGAPATRTSRLGISSRRFVPGTDDVYRPMCIDHWYQDLASRPETGSVGDGR